MAFVRGVDIPGIPIGNIAPILICPKSSLIITRFVLVGGLPRRRFPVAGDCVCLCVCVVFRAFCAFVFVVFVVVGATFVAFTVSMITGVVFVITTTVRDAVARARDSIARLTCLSLQRPDADRWTTIRTFPGAARVAAKPDGRMQTSTTMLVTTHSRASSSSRASSCAVRPNTDQSGGWRKTSEKANASIRNDFETIRFESFARVTPRSGFTLALMPQGQTLKSKAKRATGRVGAGKTKKVAANRHGKIIKQRKGKFAFSPSSTASVVSRHKQNADITRQVNEKNELEFSRRATASGGTFRLLKAPEGVELGEANRGPKPKKRAKPVVKTPAQLQAEKNASKWSY